MWNRNRSQNSRKSAQMLPCAFLHSICGFILVHWKHTCSLQKQYARSRHNNSQYFNEGFHTMLEHCTANHNTVIFYFTAECNFIHSVYWFQWNVCKCFHFQPIRIDTSSSCFQFNAFKNTFSLIVHFFEKCSFFENIHNRELNRNQSWLQ